MMADTPRSFVGRVTFPVAGMLGRHCERAVTAQLVTLPGVTQVIADAGNGTVTVSVDRPVDRADIAAAAGRCGHRLTAT